MSNHLLRLLILLGLDLLKLNSKNINVEKHSGIKALQNLIFVSEHNSLTVSVLACHAAVWGSNPAQGNDFFN